jgi:hypothetical protein
MWARTLHDFSFLICFINKYFRRLSFIFKPRPASLNAVIYAVPAAFAKLNQGGEATV